MRRAERDSVRKVLAALRREVKSLQGTRLVGTTLAAEGERTAYQNVINLIDTKLRDGGTKRSTRRQ